MYGSAARVHGSIHVCSSVASPDLRRLQVRKNIPNRHNNETPAFCCNCGTNTFIIFSSSSSSSSSVSHSWLRHCGSDHWPVVGNAATHQRRIILDQIHQRTLFAWIRCLRGRTNAHGDVTSHMRLSRGTKAQRPPPVGACPEAGGHRARGRPHTRRPGPRTSSSAPGWLHGPRRSAPLVATGFMVCWSNAWAPLGMSCLTARPATVAP